MHKYTLILSLGHSNCAQLQEYFKVISQTKFKISNPFQFIFEEQKLEYNFKRKMKFTLIAFSMFMIFATSLPCQQGSVTNLQNICVTPNYIEGCSQYLNNHQCATCNYRYVLQSNGLCELNAQTTQECCQIRGPNNKCITCQTGLYLIDGRCTQSNLLGCLEKDVNGVCTNCALDFALKNGACSKIIRNCNKYVDAANTICAECKPDHSLTHNICVKNQILGCKLQENGICKQCVKPFYSAKDRCQIRNCQAYNEYKCVACECGYYLNSEGSCQQMSQGCIRYNRGVCGDCRKGFRLKGNHCEMEGCTKKNGLICQECSQEFLLVNGICKMKNCVSWKDSSCQICETGYNYHEGKCIQAKKIVSE